MPLAQRNATLTLVRSDSGPDSWDSSGAGDQKFAGAADAYYRETRARRQAVSGSGAGTSKQRRDRTLVVERRLGIVWAVGDVVTFTPDGRDPITAKVLLDIDRPAPRAAAIPTGQQTVRLTLEDA